MPGRPIGGAFPETAQAGSSADLALLTSLRARDPQAYERLVREQTGRLLSVARRLLRNDDDARDAVQEAFLSAFRAIDRFEGASRLSTWLHRIVVNVCLMRLRSRNRGAAEEGLDDLLPSFSSNGHHATAITDWSQDAHAALEQQETRALVHRAIDALPESYRTALILRDIEELDTAEVATMLGITPNAVKVRVHRARQALRTLLDREFRGARSS
jgi:RNA polymerase sigma-70 factor (ECF subfamily)